MKCTKLLDWLHKFVEVGQFILSGCKLQEWGSLPVGRFECRAEANVRPNITKAQAQ